MKYAEINRRVTEIAADYIRCGYSINTSTMGGGQGEVSHIDLTDGRSIIRILVQHFYCKDDFYNDGYEIIVGRADDTVRADQPPANTVGTIWNDRMNLFHREAFYEIGKRRGRPAWYGNRDEAVAAGNVRVKRCAYHYELVSKDSLPSYAIKIAERYIRRVTGIKRPNKEKLNVRHAIRHTDGLIYGQYIVTYNGKSYILH